MRREPARNSAADVIRSTRLSISATSSRLPAERCAEATTVRSKHAQRACSCPMMKARTSSEVTNAPLPAMASRPQEKETDPEGKKLSPCCSTFRIDAKSTMIRKPDFSLHRQVRKPRSVVFGGAFEGDQDGARLEAHPPMEIAGEISGLEGAIEIARRNTEPSLFRHPDDDCSIAFEVQHRAIGKLLAAVKDDCDFGTFVGHTAQPPS